MQELEKTPLIVAAGALWQKATRAAFLDALGDGSLPPAVFGRWLEQEYRFGCGLVSFQAVTAAKTPRPSHRPVIAGLAAMDAGLEWLENHLVRHGLSSDAPAHPACRRYTNFLLAVAYAQPFEVSLAVLFGVNVCHLRALVRLDTRGPYGEAIARWSDESFATYVRTLHELTQRHRHPAQEGCFTETLWRAHDFWRMAWED